MRFLVAPALMLIGLSTPAQIIPAKLTALIEAEKPKVIEWRRQLHLHPELGNREFKTSAMVAAHLRSLGLEVKTGVATTGVVGILRGGKPGPVVALRADMDGLPVTERNTLPFKSTDTTIYNNQKVGVMHACGHDTHTSILMGTAEVLSKMKNEVPGTVVFLFQPAEEGPPEGELGGAKQMVAEGVLDNPKVDAVFGLHIKSEVPTGSIEYRPEGFMAAVNTLKIIITGKQAHGANPWFGIDPIVTSAEIINNLQTIVSRTVRITHNPAVVTIGSLHAGVRSNIIPESAEMLATVRTFSDEDETLVLKRINDIVTKTAEMNGAKAEIISIENNHYPVTYNDPALTAKMLPALNEATGNKVKLRDPETGAEDFSFFQKKVPGLFFFLGGLPDGADPAKAAPHHTPDFLVDDSNLDVGVKAFCNLVFLYAKKGR